MLDRKNVMPISFLKMEKFTGSERGLRFRMEISPKQDPDHLVEPGKPDDDAMKDPAKLSLIVTVWPEPYSYDFTPEEQKTRKQFTFDEQGIEDGVAWINEIHDTFVGG